MGGPVPRSSTDSRPVRVVAFYHRPEDDPFHGGSLHFKGFVEGLRRTVPVDVVAPSPPGRGESTDSIAPARIVGVRYLIRAAFAGGRFLWQTKRNSSAPRSVLVAFDVYVAGLVAFLARLRGVPMAYYPQDLNEEVTQTWTAERLPGSLLFRTVRWPLERAGVRYASLILVPSESMREQWASRRSFRSPLLLCHLNRSVPVFRPEDVRRWRDRLRPGGRMVAVFVGSFQYPPNLDAFRYVQTTLAPDLARRDPQILLVVAGLDSEPFVSLSTDNLRVLGTVEDLDGLLFSADVGLAPMVVPGGTSGKIVDYVLHGLDVVATPEAARGVRATPRLRIEDLSRFSDLLIEIHHQRNGAPDIRTPAPIDPVYLSSYVDDQELRSIGRELVRLADPARD